MTRYIVDIPGTKSWALPGQQDGTAPDLGSNLRLMGGQDTVCARGIEQAMDAASNPDNPNHTPVTFDGRTGSIGGNHDMGQYVGGGAAVDRSGDPGLRQLRNQMGEDG